MRDRGSGRALAAVRCSREAARMSAEPGRLAPLNALKAFEAVGRRLSLSRAAEELSVTVGAVSQQIRLLEDHAGGALIRREGRSTVLTDLGAELHAPLQEAFERLRRASELIYRPARRRQLTISAPPSFAAKWLAPRIARFAAERPEIELWMSADMALADVAGGRVDLAIRYGRGDYPGVLSRRLLAGAVAPMCSPALISGERPLRRPADLVGHALIHVRPSGLEEPRPDWSMWLRVHGVDSPDPLAGPRFDQTALAIEAAIHGRGLVLAPPAFVRGDIEAGRLVLPFADGLMETPLAYHLLTRRSPHADADALAGWLLSEAQWTEGAIDEL